MPEINVIYETEAYVVCQKPSGVMSEDGKVAGMPSLLCAEKPLLTVHRLDKEVGGVTVYAKKSNAAAVFMKQIQDGLFLKEYYAVIEGQPQENGRYEDLLFKDSSKNKSFIVKRERKGVKRAILNFERIKTVNVDGKTLSLVRIRLKTGRTHQIRVQFSHRGTPVYGDKKYGSNLSGGFGLFLKRIGFKCPTTGEYKEFELPFPNTYPWKYFD